MGLIREPDGVDFIINSGPLTPEDAAEISAWIRRRRAATAKARAAREKLEAKALALPSAERTQLAYHLLSSLATEESDEPAREWAAAAKARFETLRSPQPSVAPNQGKKAARRTKSARTRTDSQPGATTAGAG